jgi:glycosyltransferase involved in cell wall biosynthesis
MRIAVAAHSSTRAGGVETYLAGVIPGLAARGHEVACWFESIGYGAESIVSSHQHGPVWTAKSDARDALQALGQWKPDVIYLHGLRSVPLERQLIGIAPVVFFAHSYSGSCISGEKLTRLPVLSPCDRVFGPACLAHYFPRLCGGLSPMTMALQYRTQRAKQQLLHEYDALLVASAHMAHEYEAQGVRTRVVHLPVAETAGVRPDGNRSRWNLLYLGRLERSKGVNIALRSSARAADLSATPVRLVVAGEGSLSRKLQSEAAALTRNGSFVVAFPGWLSETGRASALGEADLLLVPSLWPEPFGLVGIEAASAGVPSIAFRVGGIEDWLADGVNGRTVPLTHDRVEQFADAIVQTLSDPDRLEAMRRQAVRTAQAFTMAAHLERLEPVLQEAAESRPRHVLPA